MKKTHKREKTTFIENLGFHRNKKEETNINLHRNFHKLPFCVEEQTMRIIFFNYSRFKSHF